MEEPPLDGGPSPAVRSPGTSGAAAGLGTGSRREVSPGRRRPATVRALPQPDLVSAGVPMSLPDPRPGPPPPRRGDRPRIGGPDPQHRPVHAAERNHRRPADAPERDVPGDDERPFGPELSPDRESILRDILEERDWLRRVAHSLTDDAHLAEDVVQSAYLAAMRAPPDDPRRRRAWLRTVVRNFLRLSHRESTRREAREKVAARSEAIPPVEPAVDEAELRALVAAAVAALGEPYRRTVVEHFYRGRTSTEIAAEEGVAPNTVRVRIRRALLQIGAVLDRRSGGRRELWLVPLLGLFLEPGRLEALAARHEAWSGPPPAAPRPARPRAAAAIPLAVLVVGTIVFLGGGFGPWTGASGGDPDPAAVEPRAAPVAAAESPEAGDALPGRASDPEPAPGIVPAPPEAPRLLVVRDRASGAPIAGAEVFLDPAMMASERLARGRSALEWLTQPFATERAGATDANGRIELSPERLGRDRLLVRAPGFLEHRERERLRRGRGAEGVLEVALRPAALGALDLRLPDGAPARDVAVRIVGASGAVREGRTDLAGRLVYDIEEAEHRFEIDLDGFLPVREIALPPEQTIALVRGVERRATVSDARGRPVEGARATVARDAGPRIAAETDARGTLRFVVAPGDESVRIEIEHPDHAARSIALTLDAPELRIELADAAWVEGIVEGPDGPVAAGTILAIPEGPFFARDLVRAEIDPDGRFRLGPLAAADALLRIESPGLAAAECPVADLHAFETRELALRLGSGAALEGRIVDPEGAPLAGVRLQVGAVVGDELRGPVVESDAEGRFRIDGIPAEPPLLRPAFAETRWTAFPALAAHADAGEAAADPPRGLLLQVLAPHQLRAADGVAVPALSFLGSRNTVALAADARTIELVVDARPPRGLPRVELVDPDGDPVRDIVNWLVLPAEDPTDRSRIFAGTDGNPVNVGDAAAIEGSWVALVPRRHAIAGGVLRLRADDAPWIVELWPRVERTIRFIREDGTPHAYATLWWRPDDPEAIAAIALGRTDAEGVLVADFLAPGRCDIVEGPPAAVAGAPDGEQERDPVPGLDALPVGRGRVIGTLDVPRADGSRLEARVRPPAEEDGGGE